MKKFLSLSLVIIMLFTLTSCFKSEKKYDYDMTQYVTLPDYSNYSVEVNLDSLQQTIDSNIINQATTTLRATKGDDVYFSIKAYEYVVIGQDESGNDIDEQGEEITSLTQENIFIENLGNGNYDLAIENEIINQKVPFGNSRKVIYTFPADYKTAELQNKKVYLEMTFLNRVCKKGDIVGVSYTGYYIDANEDIVIENGEKKTFDSGTGSFYIGSHLAIDDFENGMIGMLSGADNTKTFVATFPEDYSAQDLKGQKTKFEVTINTYYSVPVYNVSFIQQNFGDFDSVDDFENAVIKQYADQKFLEYVVTNAQILDYPKAEYKSIEKQLEDIEDDYASNYGVSLDDYISAQYGMTRDEYIKSSMKLEMIYYAIAQKENVVPTDDDLATAKQVLIAYNQELYMQNNQNVTQQQALEIATNYVENELDKNAIYDEALFKCVETKLASATNISKLTKSYTSVTYEIAEKAETN